MPRKALIIIGVLVLLVVLFFGYRFVSYQLGLSKLPPQNTPVTFVGPSGIGEQYLVKGSSLALNRTVLENGVIITESVDSPIQSGEKVVLFRAPGVEGIIAGIAHANGTLTALVSGGTNKADLLVRNDGLAVFTVGPVGAPASEETSSPEDEIENEVEETYTATGPTTISAAPEAIAPAAQLIALNIGTGSILPLGVGYSPRLLANGSVIALTPDGIALIDPVSRNRSMLLKQSMTGLTPGRISPSGQAVALVGPENASVELYRVNPSVQTPVVNVGFLEWDGRPLQLAFADDTHFFVRASNTSTHYYAMPTEKVQAATPIVSISLIR